jgi:zinc transport system ATP-binding protein
MKDLLIKCNKVSYKKKHAVILKDIDLNLYSGDIITVIGPNGGGKTSLAKIILGIKKPTSGKIERKKGLVIGYMPQKINLNPMVPIAVREFLLLNKVISDYNLDKIMFAGDINHILDTQITDLSGGELQRVLFSRALMGDPELLILDEPIQGLDVSGQKEFYAMIDRVRSELKKSIIMISHDLYTVMSSSDSVMCLNQTVHCSGKPHSIKSEKSYQDLFKLDGAEVISTYAHKHKGKDAR